MVPTNAKTGLHKEVERLEANKKVLEDNILRLQDEEFLLHIYETGSVKGAIPERTHIAIRRLQDFGLIEYDDAAREGHGGYIATAKGLKRITFLYQEYGDA